MALKLKATTAPTDQCPEGTYACKLVKIENWVADNNGNSEYNSGPQFKWIFHIGKVIYANPVRPTKDNPEPRQPQDWVKEEIWGFTSQIFTAKAKCRQWAEGIIERELEEDEEFDLESLFGARVVILVGRSQTGKHKIIDVNRYHAGAPAQQAEAEPEPEPEPVATADDDFDDDLDDLPF